METKLEEEELTHFIGFENLGQNLNTIIKKNFIKLNEKLTGTNMLLDELCNWYKYYYDRGNAEGKQNL